MLVCAGQSSPSASRQAGHPLSPLYRVVTRRYRAGRLRFFRTIAESVGVQGPTAGVVIAPAVLASVSSDGTALVELVAAMAMGFVA